MYLHTMCILVINCLKTSFSFTIEIDIPLMYIRLSSEERIVFPPGLVRIRRQFPAPVPLY